MLAVYVVADNCALYIYYKFCNFFTSTVSL